MSGYKRIFGEIPGFPEGWTAPRRRHVQQAGLHAELQAGISGTPHEGADAIVLNEGYPDDRDYGPALVYTGHGGRDPDTKLQIADQTITRGNAALVKSKLEGLPVRVIRGYALRSPYAPTVGYRYDGLYRVIRHWFKLRDDGFRVCQFLMVKIDPSHDIDEPDSGDIISVPIDQSQQPIEPIRRSEIIIRKINRRAMIVRQVKVLYGNQCQICGQAVDLPNGPSSEAAHIRAVGVPHNGPDTLENILCLCPNDHVRFDNGALYLTDDLKVMSAITGEFISTLRVHRQHRIAIEHVRYHRGCWSDK